MKVLIITRSFYPRISPRSFRATELAKELAKRNIAVTVLTVYDIIEHPKFEKEHKVKIKDLGEPSFKDIETKSKLKIVQLFYRFSKRILNLLFEYPDIGLMFQVEKKLRNEDFYDLLISIAVPHPIHWGVAKLYRNNKRIAGKWIADCGDPYMKVTLDTFNKLFYFKYFEKEFCRKADYISVPTEKAIDGYYPEFKSKIKVIPQGFNFKEVDISNTYKKNDITTLLYAGSLIAGAREIGPFIEYLLSKYSNFRFIIYTKKKNLVQPYVIMSNGMVIIKDYIPRIELIRKMATADFLVNVNNGVQIQTPSKLIDYYLTGRPIISIDSFDFDTQNVDRFMAGDYSGKYVFENVDQYRIENVVSQFLNLAEENTK